MAIEQFYSCLKSNNSQRSSLHWPRGPVVIWEWSYRDWETVWDIHYCTTQWVYTAVNSDILLQHTHTKPDCLALCVCVFSVSLHHKTSYLRNFEPYYRPAGPVVVSLHNYAENEIECFQSFQSWMSPKSQTSCCKKPPICSKWRHFVIKLARFKLSAIRMCDFLLLKKPNSQQSSKKNALNGLTLKKNCFISCHRSLFVYPVNYRL